MAVYSTYHADTDKEDLTDVLTKIGQMDTPVFSGIKKVSASNTYHEWSTYDYSAAATNAQIEGATYSYSILSTPDRDGNYSQIFRKLFQVSNTQQAVNPAGMENEYSFRVEVALKEIGKDIENALVNGTANSGASGTGRRLKGISAFITDNIVTAAGATATGAALTEAGLNELLQDIYSDGGHPDWLLCSYRQQRAIAELASADRVYNDDNTKFTSKVTLYQSPFGMLRVDGDSVVTESVILALSKNTWAVAQLRPVSKIDTPATADAKNGVVHGELTLEGRSDKYNGKMTGLYSS